MSVETDLIAIPQSSVISSFNVSFIVPQGLEARGAKPAISITAEGGKTVTSTAL